MRLLHIGGVKATLYLGVSINLSVLSAFIFRISWGYVYEICSWEFGTLAKTVLSQWRFESEELFILIHVCTTSQFAVCSFRGNWPPCCLSEISPLGFQVQVTAETDIIRLHLVCSTVPLVSPTALFVLAVSQQSHTFSSRLNSNLQYTCRSFCWFVSDWFNRTLSTALNVQWEVRG
jgi:hypothetical protein